VGRNAKINYELVKQKYMTEGRSYASLAAEFGVTAQSIAAVGKRDDWRGQRMAYQNAVSRRTVEKMAEGVASEGAVIRSEAVLVARATLRRYAQDIAEGKVAVTAKDAALMIELLVNELAPDNSRENDAPIIVSPSGDADLLRRVVEAARGRATLSGSVGDPPLGGATRTRSN
jgi:hypothetical protein